MDQQGIAPLLWQLMSADNTARSTSEAQYTGLLQSSPASLAMELLKVVATLRGAEERPLRTIAAVLVRRIVDPRGSAWAQMAPDAQTQVRSALQECFMAETDPFVLRKICHAIGKASGDWKGLVEALVNALQGTSDVDRQVSIFFLLEQMAEYSDELKSNAGAMVPVFQVALGEGMDARVRLAAVKAAMNLIASASSDDAVGAEVAQALKPLISPVLAAVAVPLHAKEPTQSQEVLEMLADVATLAPAFVVQDLKTALALMVQVGSDPSFAPTVRSCAVEVLLSCCEAAPAAMRRVNGFAKAFFLMCMELAASGEEDQREWEQTLVFSDSEGSGEDDEEGGAASIAEEAIYRMVNALAAKTMVPIVTQAVPAWLLQEDHRPRRIALVSICALVDYCAKGIRSEVAKILKTAVDYSNDRHPRVVAQALLLLRSLATSFPDLAERFHAQVFPALGNVLANTNHSPRVRGTALNSLVTVAHESCSAECLAPYLHPLLTALCTCLESHVPPPVQEIALEAVSRLASASGADFSSHYTSFMPGLKGILRSPAAAQNASLRDRALECVAFIGLAVGRRVFSPDAAEVMHLLASEVMAQGDSGDVTLERFGPATATLCEAIEEDFVQYLPALLPTLLRAVGAEIDFRTEDVDEETAPGVEESADSGTQTAVLDIRGVGRKRITLNTFAVVEKAAALDTLEKYARVLGWRFVDYVEPLVPVVFAQLTCRFSEDVRTSAALALASLFDVVVQAVQKGMRPVNYGIQALIDWLPAVFIRLDNEHQAEGRQYMAQAIRDMLRICAESGGVDETTGLLKEPLIKLPNTKDDVKRAVQKARDAIVCSLQRRGEEEKKFEDNEHLEADDYEAVLECVANEAELVRTLTDAIGYLLKAERAAFLPLFETELLHLLEVMLGEDGQNPAFLVQVAVCLFDDCIEFCGAGAHKYLPVFFPILMRALERACAATPQDEEEDEEEAGDLILLRQACVYGITQICKHAPEFFDGVATQFQVLPKLLKLLNDPQRNDADFRAVTENAVSALGSMCQGVLARRLQVLPPDNVFQFLGLYLSHLPLYEDSMEAVVVHRQLCDLLDLDAPAVLGKSMERAGDVVRIVGDVCKRVEAQKEKGETDLIADDHTLQRLAGMTAKLQTMVPGEAWNAAWSAMDEKSRVALQRAVPSSPN